MVFKNLFVFHFEIGIMKTPRTLPFNAFQFHIHASIIYLKVSLQERLLGHPGRYLSIFDTLNRWPTTYLPRCSGKIPRFLFLSVPPIGWKAIFLTILVSQLSEWHACLILKWQSARYLMFCLLCGGKGSCLMPCLTVFLRSRRFIGVLYVTVSGEMGIFDLLPFYV